MLSITLVSAQFIDLVQFKQSKNLFALYAQRVQKKKYRNPAELPRFDYHLHIYANSPDDFCGRNTKQKGFLQFVLEGGGFLSNHPE